MKKRFFLCLFLAAPWNTVLAIKNPLRYLLCKKSSQRYQTPLRTESEKEIINTNLSSMGMGDFTTPANLPKKKSQK